MAAQAPFVATVSSRAALWPVSLPLDGRNRCLAESRKPRLRGFTETRPRGFEPLTFGSVGGEVGGARVAFGSAARFSRRRCGRCEPRFRAIGHAVGTVRAPSRPAQAATSTLGGGEVGRLGDRLAGLAKAFEMQGDGVLHPRARLLRLWRRWPRRRGGRARKRSSSRPWRLRSRSGSGVRSCVVLEPGLSDGAQVFGCKVSDGLPATVTTPGRLGWRY